MNFDPELDADGSDGAEGGAVTEQPRPDPSRPAAGWLAPRERIEAGEFASPTVRRWREQITRIKDFQVPEDQAEGLKPYGKASRNHDGANLEALSQGDQKPNDKAAGSLIISVGSLTNGPPEAFC